MKKRFSHRLFIRNAGAALAVLELPGHPLDAQEQKESLPLSGAAQDSEGLRALGIDPAALSTAAGFIEDEVRKGSIPGALLVASRGGTRFFEAYWGSRCSQSNRNDTLDASTQHMVASFSKVTTATVVTR